MMLSVMVMGTGATSFSDEDEFSPQYKEAAEVLTGMGVMQGYEDGSYFLPQRNITRAQVATLIYRAVTGDVNDTQTDLYKDWNKFKDVPSTDWSAGYVNYCANGEIIKGFTPDTFGPLKNVTGYQVLAMILRAIGYDANDEFTGEGWEVRTATTAKEIGLLDNVQDTTLGVAASRELVAELIFRAMNADMVEYNLIIKDYVPVVDKYGNETLGQREFDLVGPTDTKDDWGNPGYLWKYEVNGKDAETTISIAPVATYDVATSECDIATALDEDGRNISVETYDNGVFQKDKDSINATATKAMLGGQGTQIQVYDYTNANDKQVNRLVIVDTYLANVTKVNEATYDDAGHPDEDAYSNIQVWGLGNITTGTIDSVAYDKDAYILVNYNQGTEKFYDVQEADAFVGAQTRIWWNASQHTINGETYDDAAHFALDKAGRTQTENFTWFLDQYGNVIGNVELDRTGYAVLKDIIWKVGTPGYAEATLVYMDGSEATVVVDEFDGLTDDWTADSWPYNWNPWSPAATRQDEAPVLDDDGTAFPGVSSDSKYNDFYEGYALYVVTTNDDGTVDLDEATTAGGTVAYDSCSTLDNNSSAIILDDGTRLTVTANTQFLVRNGDGTYSAYNRATLPELAQNNEIFYTTTADDNDVAECVYVKNGVNEAELGSHLFVITDNYSRIAGEPNTFEMVVNVDGVERTIATNEANVKYLAANEGKLFHVTWELNPYAGFYGFVDELYLMNEQEDNEPVCDYMSSVTYSGNTLYNADDSYTVDADTVIVGNNGVIDASKGIWVICDDIKTTHAAVVYVGTKLGPSTAFDTDSKYEVVYDEAAKEYVITIPYTETDNDIDVWAVAQNAVLVYDGTAYLNLGYDGLRQEATLDITALMPGEELEFEFEVWAENGVAAIKDDVTLVVEMTTADCRSNLITGIADRSIICDDEAAGYTSVDKAPVLPLDISKANELTISLVNDTVKASWATYTSTALAENGKASDFTAMGATLSTSVLDEGDILVLKIEKTDADLSITLDDNYTTAPALYVVYQINK